jgi:hypothetical protein
MAGSRKEDPIPPITMSRANQDALRLFIIPLLVFLAWLTEVFLLEGTISLFRTLDPFAVLFYTLVGCILTGMVIPVLIIRRSFINRAVNMFQIGFRSPRRALPLCTVTAVFCFFIAFVMVPSGINRTALPELFLLYLPTGIASVMICWVLIGTHLQALVRPGGVLVSVSTGVVITSILFGLTTLVHTPATGLQDPLAITILLGIVTALFFFSVRDVYATVIVATTGMVLLFPGRADMALLSGSFSLTALASTGAVASLLGIHLYFSRNYATVLVVPKS